MSKEENFTNLKLKLVDEQASPLFRIMSIYNDDDPVKRKFSNNICAFHIGNGFILSVAHNLRIPNNAPSSIPEYEYTKLSKVLNSTQKQIFDNEYTLDTKGIKRHLNSTQNIRQIVDVSNQINYDLRYCTQYKNGFCKPFLIIQFRENKFYKDSKITKKINPLHIFPESKLARFTFLIELELVKGFYSEDIAVYKIVNTPKEVIDKIPFLKIDYTVHDRENELYYCLQSAPVDNLGRLLNDASIEGVLDHWNSFYDKIEGNYIMDGLRYLIKGYFRFGSSGAPYITYDQNLKEFKFNAIQSEASPIQLSINNNKNGNFQYINAIATPLKVIKEELSKILRDTV